MNIYHDISNYKIMESEYNYLKDKLDKFLKLYYLEVGDIFYQMDKYKITHNISQNTANDQDYIEVANDQDYKQIECKKYYKKLAKIFHPDIKSANKDPDSDIIFKMIKNAYEEGNLTELISIENTYAKPEQDKNQNIQNDISKIANKLKKLKSSKEYKLYNLYKKNLTKGIDLIAQIKKTSHQKLCEIEKSSLYWISTPI